MSQGELPAGIPISYSRQYRRCGKPGCRVCGLGALGHGPYWYAYWREGGRKCSRYLGKQPPAEALAGQPAALAPADTASKALRVRSLGTFAVWLGDERVPAERWNRRKVAALFKCLLSAPQQRLHREQLTDLLWPEVAPEVGAANLRTTLYRLRAALGNDDHEYVQYDGEMLVLVPGPNPPPDWLDATAFERAAHGALASRETGAARVALAIYAGEYLPGDAYEEWAVRRREELHELWIDLLLHLAGLAAANGDTEEAERCLNTILARDRCHEGAALALMRLYAADERPMHGLRIYRRLAEALREELDLEPEEETRAMYRALNARRSETLDRPLPAPRAMATNLTAQLTSFIGRRQELHALEDMLRPAGMDAGPPEEAAHCRLLTLIGPGGCGKTRLALQVADDLLEQYSDGVWLVDLAALPAATEVDSPLVHRAVAAVFGLREEPDQPLAAALTAFLRGRQVLLVLDNCEHLVEPCASLATMLLQSCPALQIIATSREALGVAGEQPWLVPSLSLPQSGAAAAPEHLLQYEAVRLFLDRARIQQPGLRITEELAPAVLSICRRLDGMPLAIELAAARVGMLSLDQIAARLQQCFRVLTGGPRSAPARHQTLRATLNWSYDLLGPVEQTLLARLAVFAGGCTLEAAEAVSSDDDGTADTVLDVLDQLHRKSLLVRSDGNGDGRYRLLETVRQYGQERLVAAGELATVQQRHAAFFLCLAEQAARELRGPAQDLWLARLEQEHDNLRAALSWAGASGDHECGLAIAGALWRFWRMRGYMGEGREWLESLLDGGCAASHTRARALVGAGTLARDQGDYAQAVAWLQEGLCLARQADDAAEAAAALSTLATVAKLQGEYAQAIALHEESLALYRKLDDRHGIAFVLGDLGNVARRQGDYTRATALQEESLVLRREMGDRHAVAVALNNLAMVAYERGAHAQCQAWLEEGLTLARDMKDTEGIATSLQNLGSLLVEQGNFVQAQALTAEALTLKHEVGDKEGMAVCLVNMAEVTQALQQPLRAAHLLSAATAIWVAMEGALPPQYQASVTSAAASARAALGEAQFTTAWRAAGAWSIERAIGYALEDLAPSPGVLPVE